MSSGSHILAKTTSTVTNQTVPASFLAENEATPDTCAETFDESDTYPETITGMLERKVTQEQN